MPADERDPAAGRLMAAATSTASRAPNGVALHAEQRRAVVWGLRNEFGVLDPTGEQAVFNVMKDGRRARRAGGDAG